MGWSEGIAGLMREAGQKENTSPLYFGRVESADPVKIMLQVESGGENNLIEVSEEMENLQISKLLRKGRRYPAKGSWNFEPVSDDTRVSEVDGWWESLQNYLEAGDTAILLTADGDTFYLIGVV